MFEFFFVIKEYTGLAIKNKNQQNCKKVTENFIKNLKKSHSYMHDNDGDMNEGNSQSPQGNHYL